MATLTNWKKLSNTNYLGSFDLDNGNGGYNDAVLTIKNITQEVVMDQKGGKEPCIVCYFAENAKPMILNKTNCKTIAKLAQSQYIEKWAGLKIQIGVEKVDAFGTTTDGLRVRKNKVAQNAPAQSEAPAPKCEECGNDVQPAGGMAADAVANYTKQKYGRCLCAACAQKEGAKQ